MATILIVDDHPANRAFLVTLLGYAGHHLHEAKDGAEGIEAVRTARPDLVIADGLMPTMDGYEFVRRLRADPAIARTPVVFFTATYLEREAQALAAKVDQLTAVNRRLATLLDLSRRLAAERNPDTLLQICCDAARKIIGAQYAALDVRSEDQPSLRHFHISGTMPESIADLADLPTDHGLFAQLIAAGHPLRAPDIRADPRNPDIGRGAAGFPPGHPSMTSFLGVPVASATWRYGILYLADKLGAAEFDDEDEQVATTLASQLAVAYENAQRYDALQRHAAALDQEIAERRQVEAQRDQLLAQEQLARAAAERAAQRTAQLQAMTAACSEALTLDQVTELVIDQGVALPGASSGLIALLADDRLALQIVRTHGYPSDTVAAWQSIPIEAAVPLTEAVRTGEPIWIEEFAAIVARYPQLAASRTASGSRALIALPLIARGQVLGSMGLSFAEERVFDAEERAFILDLARQYAQAIDRAQLYQETQAAARRAEDRQATQLAVTRIIAESENRYDAIPALLRAICRSTDWDLGEFWRVNTEKNLLCWENDWRVPEFDDSEFVPTMHAATLARGVGLPGRVWASGQPEWVANIVAPSSPRAALALAVGFHSKFAFPILGGGTVFGVMVFFCHEAQPSNPDLLITMADIGSQIGQFFERAQTEERLWQSTQRLKTLHMIDQAILAAQSPEAIAQAALRHMRELVPCMTATVSAFDFTVQEAIVLAVESSAAMPIQRGTHVPLDVFPSLPALLQGRSFTMDDLQAPSTPAWLYQQALKAGVRSYLSVPIILQHNLIGVLNLLSDQPRAFAPEYTDIVREVCNQLAVAIQNARLFEQVRAGAESLRRMSRQLVRVQEDERRHIARELHDEVGQSLTAALLNLQVLSSLTDLGELPARLDDSMAQIKRVLQQIRTLSLNLRPVLLDDLGLVPALRWLVSRQAERAGFDAKLHVDFMDERFAADIETTCFRAVQEAITNIVRYAQAQRVTIELLKRATELCVSIRDDGVGFEVAAALQRAAQGHSMGLLSMQERVLLLGGQMRIESAPGQGAMIEMCLPLVLPAAEVPAITRSSLP